MNKTEAKKRIDKLTDEINYHSYRYHALDKPDISDEAWDSMKKELKDLEKRYPHLVRDDSPHKRVGSKPLDKFEKVRHKIRMMSMDDAFEYSEVLDWEKRISKLLARKPDGYFAELKMDGLAVSLIYENGKFVRAVTRGDGRVGEDVTQNVRTIREIPLRLITNKLKNEKTKKQIENGRFEVRGEIYLTKSEFEKINKKREKENLPLYANPRNLSAGTIRQLDPKIPAKRNLRFNIYEITTDIGTKYHSENFKLASKLGFRVNKYAEKFNNISHIEKLFQGWQKRRNKLAYQVDGIVVKIDNLKERTRLGSVGKSYRWEIAYKWPAEQSTTVVKDILVQVGRTGALTPVAVLEPVLVAGSTVSRATLHNEDEVIKKDVRVGDTVIIQKAGDVIPEVVEVMKRMRAKNAKKFSMPKKCPICSTKIVRPEGEAIHRCPNPNCQAKMRRRIIHFVSKKAFDIDGLGKKIVDQLIDEGLVKSAVDIFKLKIGDLEPLERFAEKASENLYDAIQISKEISLPRFIYALGIRSVGEEMAEDLAKQFGTFEKLRKAKYEEIRRMYGVADKTAKEICDWLSNNGHQKFIDDLLEVGIKVKKYHSPIKTNKLKGQSFVVTGTLQGMSREDAHKKIIQYGGNVNSSVSAKTDYLVAGENPGSKLEKARRNGVRIINEKKFLEMMK